MKCIFCKQRQLNLLFAERRIERRGGRDIQDLPCNKKKLQPFTFTIEGYIKINSSQTSVHYFG